MESGPSRMYVQQTAAFSLRDQFLSELETDSTPESPPSFTAPNLEALADLKRQVLQNPPEKCVHCGAGLTKEMIVELKDGAIMAYCKTKGACGRSLVLFAGVDVTYPIYRKICPFEAVAPAVEAQTVFTAAEATSIEQSVNVAAMEARFNRMPLDAQGNLDIYALHGIERPETMCKLCNQTYSAHDSSGLRRCDKNGWLEAGRSKYQLPSNWPVYDPVENTWTNI